MLSHDNTSYYLSQSLPDRSALQAFLANWGGRLADSVGEAAFVVVDPDTAEGAELVNRLGWLPPKDAPKDVYRGTCVTARWVWTQLEDALEDAVEKLELRVLAAGGDSGEMIESSGEEDEMDDDPFSVWQPSVNTGESSSAALRARRPRAELLRYGSSTPGQGPSSNPLRIRLVVRQSSLTPRQHANRFSPYPVASTSGRSPHKSTNGGVPAAPSAGFNDCLDGDGVRLDFDQRVAEGEDGRPAWCPVAACDRHYKDAKGLSQHWRRTGDHGVLGRQLWAKLKRAGRLPAHVLAAPDSPEMSVVVQPKIEEFEIASPSRRQSSVFDPTLPSPGSVAAAVPRTVRAPAHAGSPATLTATGMLRSYTCPVCGKAYVMERKLRTHIVKTACGERLPPAELQKLQNGQLPSDLGSIQLEPLPSPAPAPTLPRAETPSSALPQLPTDRFPPIAPRRVSNPPYGYDALPMDEDKPDGPRTSVEGDSADEDAFADRTTPESLSSALPPSMRHLADGMPALGLRRITSTPGPGPAPSTPAVPLPSLPKFALPSIPGATPSSSSATPTTEVPAGDPRPFKCPNPTCSKSWKNKNGLKYHLNHGNCNGVLSTMSRDEAIAHERPFTCPVPGCNKRWKNANGFRYHMEHTGAHGRTARKMHEDAGGFVSTPREVYRSSVVPDEDVEEED